MLLTGVCLVTVALPKTGLNVAVTLSTRAAVLGIKKVLVVILLLNNVLVPSAIAEVLDEALKSI